MLRDRSVFQETLTETENAADVEIFLVKSRKSRKVFNSTSKKHPHKFSIIHSPITVLNMHNLNTCYMKSTCFHVHGPKPLCGFVELWKLYLSSNSAQRSISTLVICHKLPRIIWLKLWNDFSTKTCLNWKKKKKMRHRISFRHELLDFVLVQQWTEHSCHLILLW